MQSFLKLIQKTLRMAGPKHAKVVLHNVLSLSGLQAITYLLPVIVLPYLFQTLGPEKFGLIAFAQSFVQYFMILTDYGFSISATREISLHHHEHEQVTRIFSSVMLVKLSLAFFSLLILSILIYFIPRFREDWIVYVLSFGSVAGSTLFPVWFFQGIERMKYIAVLNIIGEIVLVICIFTFVRSADDYVMVPLIYSSIFLSTGLAGQYIALRKFRIRYKFEGYRNVHQQLTAGWNVFTSIVAINAYTSTRIFIVGLLTNNTLTGYYSIAERIANAIQTFPLSSFTQALFPRLSKIYHKNKFKAWTMMQHIQEITNIISLLCLPAIFLLSPLIVRLVCGGEYPEVTLSLQLLLISVMFISANAFRVQFLLVCGKTREYSRIHITMALMGLPMILILISNFASAGAALATVIIEGGIFMLTYLTLRTVHFRKLA